MEEMSEKQRTRIEDLTKGQLINHSLVPFSLRFRDPRNRLSFTPCCGFAVRNAFEGGADRLELCSALSEGGLTPSLGFLKSARKATRPDFPIFVMIRPRGGDFVYDSAEVEIMEEDIDIFKRTGDANGFVFGLLTSDNKIDVENCKRLLEAAKPLPVTFHRAFDELDQVDEALDTITELGFTRLLTSGGAATAEEGIEVISRLVRRSNGRLIIMPGSGVTPANLRAILTATRTTEFHGSTKGARTGNGIVVASQATAREMKEIGTKCGSPKRLTLSPLLSPETDNEVGKFLIIPTAR